ncbi:MAG: adenine deaminase [Richelia sp.]|nr:adenine deaminase [Richelia sp.]
MDVGLIELGDAADFIVVNNLQEFVVNSTYCQGIFLTTDGQSLLPSVPVTPMKKFAAEEILTSDLHLPAAGKTVRVIAVEDGQLITTEKHLPVYIEHGEVAAHLKADVLKLVVVNRYQTAPPRVALVHNFRLQRGAIPASVGDDSHNIVAVGTTDEEICAAMNGIIQVKGGIAVGEANSVEVLPLPIALLIGADDGYGVAQKYAHLDNRAKELSSLLIAPFMTLSFMALLVIP